MKLLDEKGRLFGKINIIDLFVLTIIIYATIFTARWIKIAEDPLWTQVTILKAHCVVATEMADYMADIVKVGDGITDVRGKVVGYIEKVERAERHNPPAIYYSKKGDRLALYPRSGQVLLHIHIVVNTYERGGQLYSLINDGLITIGSPILISAKHYSTNGTVIRITTENGEK